MLLKHNLCVPLYFNLTFDIKYYVEFLKIKKIANSYGYCCCLPSDNSN